MQVPPSVLEDTTSDPNFLSPASDGAYHLESNKQRIQQAKGASGAIKERTEPQQQTIQFHLAESFAATICFSTETDLSECTLSSVRSRLESFRRLVTVDDDRHPLSRRGQS